MESFGKICVAVFVILVLPTAILYGVTSGIGFLAPGMLNALKALSPYIIWFIVWSLLVWMCGFLFLTIMDNS